jgi:small-conductance mechanosensitive channel
MTYGFWHGQGARTAWAVGLTIGFPAAMVLLGELILRLRRQGTPVARTLAIVRHMVLPLLAVQLFLTKVMSFRSADTLVQIVQTLLWIFLIHASLSLINDVVFASAREGSWQARMPQLLLDLARLILILVGGAIVLSRVWNLNLGALVTALGVGSLVLGLALQEPLGNVVSGILLLIERPFSVGDYISIDGGGMVGKVVDINWRTVHVEMETGERRIVPNGILAKGSITTFSRPSAQHTETIRLNFAYADPPGRIKQVLIEILGHIDGVLKEPPPSVRTQEYLGTSIAYTVNFTMNGYANLSMVRDEFLTRLWYAAERYGLTTPNASAGIAREKSAFDVWKTPEPAKLLGQFPLFGIDKASDLGEHGAHMAVRVFAQGERVIEAGETRAELYVIVAGRAAIFVQDVRGQTHEIARLSRGEFFGEMSLLSGRASDATVVALEDLVAVELDPDVLQSVIERTPRLAREIGNVMDVRRKAILSAHTAPVSLAVST